MAGVNLLPWREGRRQRGIRCWQGLLLGSLLAGALLALFGVVLAGQRLARQVEANVRLDERIAGLAEGLGQVATLRERSAALQAQWRELEGLRRQHGSIGEVLFRVMDSVPAGARLSDVQLADGELRLSGVARSGGDVALLLRNLRQAPGLGAPDLQELVSSAEGERFRLLVGLAPLEPS